MRCEIYVVEKKGKNMSVFVDSEEELKNMTVEELIRRVRPDHPYHLCKLLYKNQTLDYDRTLGYYGISNKCTIDMIVCLAGGGDEDKGVSRTESMEKQEASSGSCCIM